MESWIQKTHPHLLKYQDEDLNGKIDDICGWDFITEDPLVSSSTQTDEQINQIFG